MSTEQRFQGQKSFENAHDCLATIYDGLVSMLDESASPADIGIRASEMVDVVSECRSHLAEGARRVRAARSRQRRGRTAA